MKKSFCTILAAMLLSANAGAQEVSYELRGNTDSPENSKVYVIDYCKQQRIDSATVKDGSFSIKGRYERPAYVRLQNGENHANCILENGVINIDFKNHLPERGLRLNDEYLALIQKEKELSDRLHAQSDSINKLPDSENAQKDLFFISAMEKVAEYDKEAKDKVLAKPAGPNEFLLFYLATSLSVGPDLWIELYSKLPEYYRELPFLKVCNEKYASYINTAVGKKFVDFDVETVDGKKAKLSDYVGKGKYVLLDFWATWCGPCRKEAAEYIVPLYEKYGSRPDFDIIGVQVWEDKEQMLRYLEKNPSKYTQLLGAGDVPMGLYGFDSIPMIMLISPDGTIIERDIRGPQLELALKKVLR